MSAAEVKPLQQKKTGAISIFRLESHWTKNLGNMLLACGCIPGYLFRPSKSSFRSEEMFDNVEVKLIFRACANHQSRTAGRTLGIEGVFWLPCNDFFADGVFSSVSLCIVAFSLMLSVS